MSPATAQFSLNPKRLAIRDVDGELWEVTLTYRGIGSEPVIVLSQAAPLRRRADYCLSLFLKRAAIGEGFLFGGPGCSDTPRRLSPVAVAHLAAVATKMIPPTLGKFEVVWQLNDSRVPF